MGLKLSTLFIICVLCCQIGFTQEIHFAPVDPPVVNPWPAVLGMTQDTRGYLWIASNHGLYRYDGHQYFFYHQEPLNTNSLCSNQVECITAAKDGTIWIGTYGGGLDRLDPFTTTFTHYRHHPHDGGSLANDTVTAVIEDHNGIIWLGTSHGLDRMDPKTGKFAHYPYNAKDPNSLSNNRVRVVYEDHQGTIWVGTGSPFDNTNKYTGGLNKLNQQTNKFTRYLHDDRDPNSLADSRVKAIFEDRRGTFWIGTAGDGLHTMDRKTGKFEHHLYDPTHPEKLSRPALKKNHDYADDHIVFINEDNVGRIWIGTFGNGINIYDPKTQKTAWYGHDAKVKNDTRTNEFWCSYKTREGIVWMSTWMDPVLYKVSPYQHKIPHRRIGQFVYAYTEDNDSTLWLGTSKGLIRERAGDKQESFIINPDKVEANTIFYIEKNTENKLWLATLSYGLHLFDPVTKSVISYHHRDRDTTSLVSDSIRYLKNAGAGKLWVATANGLDLMNTRTGKFQHFRNDAKDATSISSNALSCIERDKNNSFWFGTIGNGLNKFDEKTGRFKRYLNVVGLRVLSLMNDSRNNLWAGTNNGLYLYDRYKDIFLLTKGPDDATTWGMAEDHNKNLWLNTTEGLVKFNSQTKETYTYSVAQGINPNFLTNQVYVRRNGELLVGDSSGYFVIQPAKLAHRNPYPHPIVIINKFLLANAPVLPSVNGVLTQPVDLTTQINLNHTQGTFSFGFSNIDFVGEAGDIVNSYKLENYDNNWSKGNSDGMASYYNIPPGNYIFKVKSINSDGGVTIKQIAVIISPPWWRTWWAYGLFVLLFIACLWGFTYYRSLSLMREKRILEQKVQARTEEVLQQKKEIEAQRDELESALSELKSTQNQLIQREKMASLGELTAGIAHEIQNPLNFVNNFSDVSAELVDEMQAELRNGDKDEAIALSEDLKQNLEKIRHHGKRADTIVKGMLEHSRAGAGEKQLINLNALCDEFIKLSYHGLRAKDKNFNAELISHFDPALPQINVVQQDMGRVLLNLFNNAFYAVNQKQKTSGADYKPEVAVSTLRQNGSIIIKVRDNGNGIPDTIKDKIMQPFFTTKPTGEGTGLGLSLSYDIVVKGNNGSINIHTKEGEFTEFVVSLPA